ncbi:MAG: Rieske 2Fe-2S domain-containing protein [Candidatus Lindowbacteria bacterium]|nr:Rieske 2Fe-2S domain-containing protein [Candidatus Lindowbacteria bacterium]
MSDFIEAAKVSDFDSVSIIKVHINNIAIALLKKNGKFFALHDTCPHKAYSLSEGTLDDCTLECAGHFWGFNIENGDCSHDDNIKLPVYNVKVEGDAIFISPSISDGQST